MKILIFWDIFWRIWRRALEKEISGLKSKYNPDFIIANVDNITSGRWPVEKHILEIEKLGIDVLTWWDHIFDHEKHIIDYLDREEGILIRPANFYESEHYKIPWKGYKIVEKSWKKLLVIHLMWEVFMRYNVYNPFLKAEEILKKLSDEKFDAIILDLHKEATSEWYGMLTFLDWEISFLYWTHTHIQTNDEIIYEEGTWFISDVWMVWALNSVIWAEFGSLKKRFLTGITKWKIEQKLWSSYLLNAVVVSINELRKCEAIEKIRIEGKI